MINKILRSLSQRFDSKVTAIEESKHLDSLKVDDLVGSQITHESRRIKRRKKNLVLRSSKKDNELVVESSDDESSKYEIMSLLTKNFHKFLKITRRTGRTSFAIPSKWTPTVMPMIRIRDK